MTPEHAELLERADPSLLDGEPKACALIAQFLGEHDLDHSAAYHLRTASKIVANRSVFSAWFRDVEADTGRLVLRQSPRQQVADDVFWLEQAAYHKNAWREACAHLEAMGASAKDYDRDEIAAQEDTDRQNAERADEQAAQAAPRMRAS